ncbi:hypothetical protein HYY73_00275 [Candidatus Woesearchaeota archaeon]|nr:hypothetical protein [Candidatus Woesearchaeota archaeon]
MAKPTPTHGYVVKVSLGKPPVMAALREANPEVAGRLEGLVGTMFTRLSLAAAYFMPVGDGTVLEYDATAATQDFYHDPVAALKSAGVIKSDFLVTISQINTGQPSESKFLQVRSDGFELYIYIHRPET